MATKTIADIKKGSIWFNHINYLNLEILEVHAERNMVTVADSIETKFQDTVPVKDFLEQCRLVWEPKQQGNIMGKNNFIDWDSEDTFEFKCKACKKYYEEEAIGESSLEAECPHCGEWNYSTTKK